MTRTLTLWIVLGVLLAALSLTVRADEPKPPRLTSEQKKDILLAVKDVELWQLKLQQAATELDKAKKALDTLVAASTPAGYQLTDRLDLVKLPEKWPMP